MYIIYMQYTTFMYTCIHIYTNIQSIAHEFHPGTWFPVGPRVASPAPAQDHR